MTVGLRAEIAAILRLQMAAGIVQATRPPRATHKLVEVRLVYRIQLTMSFVLVVAAAAAAVEFHLRLSC